jgi:uncharacterized membrane protein YvlD (DUF360 family)
MRSHHLTSTLTMWVASGLGILLASAIVPGVRVENLGLALFAAALAGGLNRIVWPLFIRFALPLTVLTLGAGALVVNGLMLYFVSEHLNGFTIRGIPASVGAVLTVTAVSTLVAAILSIDQRDRVRRHRAKRAKKALQRADAVDHQTPGLLFLEIDGLAYDVLRRAIRDGNAPTLARWVNSGDYRLRRWETDWSSQTGACQAGLLHGNNHDMPAFRWWEKDRHQPIVTNRPRDAAELERRISDGRGLLHEDGASRANILSGDATHSLLTMSTVLNVRRGKLGADYAAYFESPYNVARTLLLSIAEIAAERWQSVRARRLGVEPSIHRGWVYAVMRAYACVVQRDLQVSAVLDDVAVGRPVIYTTFLAYDEVAHHSGVERPEALSVLRRLDHELGVIAEAAAHAPRPYRLVVLADHGQSQGATFLQRYGLTLEALVEEACGKGAVHALTAEPDEATAIVGAAITEAATGDGVTARALRSATRKRTVDGEVLNDEGLAAADREATAMHEELPEVSVMASGCLGLISFPRLPGRVTLEQIEAHWPALLPALASHPGIGFVLVRSEVDGPVVLGADGKHLLATGEVIGRDPLAPYGPNAARHVARTDAFSRCPDLVLNSTYWAETDEVAAFEELVGSHGGMGGEQTYPFVLAPADLALPEDEVVGAEAMHRVFRGWLAGLGHEGYAE